MIFSSPLVRGMLFRELKDMKKSTLQKYIVPVMFIIIGAAGGIVISRITDEITGLSFPVAIAVGLLLFGIALYIHIIIHEGGHCLFGLLSGYRFVSFRVGSLMWLRTPEGIKRKKYSLAGTGGQCLMEPPGDINDDFPVVLYNMGGVIVNLIAAALFWLLSMLCKSNPYLHVFCSLMTVCGIGLALTNGIPLKGLVNNDGSNTLELIGNPAAKRAFWISMKVNAKISDGISIADLPEEWFEMPEKKDYNSSLISYIPYARNDRLLTLGRFEEASELRKHILAEVTGLPGIYRALLQSEDIFYELTHENRKEVIDSIYTAEFAKTVKQIRSLPPILRMECLKAKLHDHDDAKFKKNMAEYEKLLKSYPYATEGENDRRLLNDALKQTEA